MDELSALVSAMNEKYGADLGEPDKVWVDQQWSVVKGDDEVRAVTVNDDRSQTSRPLHPVAPLVRNDVLTTPLET